MITEFIVTSGEQPKRLDVFLVNRERDISRSALKRLIDLGRIRINITSPTLRDRVVRRQAPASLRFTVHKSSGAFFA